jgi:hypothetical protein
MDIKSNGQMYALDNHRKQHVFTDKVRTQSIETTNVDNNNEGL